VKWEFNGAAAAVIALANRMMSDAREAYKGDKVNGVWNWIRKLEKTHPHLVAFKGKCKADTYSQEKIESFMLRFYNALPKQFVLIMQTVTQVLEEQSSNVLENTTSRSMHGVTLVRGGAEKLIQALDAQARSNNGQAYVHCGDDTMIHIITDNGVVMFSLDCSNFDITQHGMATLRIHQKLRDELAAVDPVAAQVWYALARERIVVMMSQLTAKWKHAGPSGMPLQSKVNDMLMDVCVQRLLEMCLDWEDREMVDKFAQLVGRGMGLSIRLEDYEFVPGAKSVKEALAQKAFLFVGSRFHVREGYTYVCADIPRTYAQFPYPSLKWEKDKESLLLTEAIRCGSIAMNLGYPPEDLEASVEAFRKGCEKLLETAIRKFGANVESERLRWAVQANPTMGDADVPLPSLEGLLFALRNWKNLFGRPAEPESLGEELPHTTVHMHKAADLSWADAVDLEEQKEILAAGGKLILRYQPKLAVLKQARLTYRQAPTHKTTAANWGRPPPTAVWGPDKPKRVNPAEASTSHGGGKGKGRAGGRHPEDDFYDSMSMDSAETEWDFSDDDYKAYSE
jgi:hypothetical protein